MVRESNTKQRYHKDGRVLVNKTSSQSFLRGLVLPVTLFLLLFLFLLFGIQNIATGSDRESLKILKDAVVRATIQCYAIEGMYPPDVAYLENKYGIVYDHNRYIVHYEIFAGNILPDITVVDIGR
ncbi:hypothetical protein [Anoxybacterium hadale]|uniref:hypothetical protein n=1 Tax=Anoxybacterium hadale TaxID=3408580 RepID=UPI003B008BB6